jgi:hypothetical protein
MTNTTITNPGEIPPPLVPEDIISVLTKTGLTEQAEHLVRTEGMQYCEAIIHICNLNQIEPEDIASLVTGALKDKLHAEAQRNNFLPKSNSLFDFL